MKKLSPIAFLRSRFPLAIVAGLLLASAFPKIGIAGFAWIAPAFMLFVALGKTTKESFRLGYVAGFVHYLASLYWLLHIPVTGFPILGWMALSAFVALFPATWVWLTLKVSDFSFLISHSQTTNAVQKETSLPGSWTARTMWVLFAAALWVALEMIIARIFGGFPWNLLGASQYRMLPLIQLSSFTGVYGVSFLVVWTSVSLLCATVTIARRPTARSVWLGEIILPMAALAAAFVFGLHQLRQSPAPSREIKLALIQPSIPQTMIWDQANDYARFQNLIQLSEQALTDHPDVLIWPEAAVPSFARWDTNIYPAITNLVHTYHVWLILGSDDVGPAKPPTGDDKYEYYNASFLVSPEGKFVARYRKRSLVMFGEYIPLEHTLPFIKWFTPVTGSFTPGDKPVSFEMPDLKVKTSVLICFEDNFPHLVREYVDDDTDFLVNLTNNGWFGEGAAQWQHAANAVFRTVENGLPLIRCTNNGLTCWVDANGRIQQIFRDENGSVYGKGFMIANVPLLNGKKHSPTFYNEHGDWFGWACVGFAALGLLSAKRNHSATKAA